MVKIQQQIRRLEAAPAPERSVSSFIESFRAGFLHGLVDCVTYLMTRRNSLVTDAKRLQSLHEGRQEAERLNFRILRQRIASLATPEVEQLKMLADINRPVSGVGPALAAFFASLPMDGVNLADAYLESLELVQCEFELSRMRATSTFNGAAYKKVYERAHRALHTCRTELDWLARKGSLSKTCNQHKQALQKWRALFGIMD